MANYTTLYNKIKDRRAHIVVMGLGYVGLPLAAELAKAGFIVTGYDPDKSKVESLLKGVSYLEYPSTEDVNTLVLGTNKLTATHDFGSLDRHTIDVVIICVPTPLSKNREPDLSMVKTATRELWQSLKANTLVILESTTYPGTTRDVVLPILCNTTWDTLKTSTSVVKLGENLFVGYSPERIDPGNKVYNLTNTPKVVSGITDKCLKLTSLLYGAITNEVVEVSSVEVAEMAKIVENTFRFVNISLVNEFALTSKDLGVDIFEVIDAAKTKPYGFMPFYPGPGQGGHCTPIDPLYLTWRLKGLHKRSRFIELADEINLTMPKYVVSTVTKALNSVSKSVKDSNILILGVTYKPDVGDFRETPVKPIIAELLSLEANVYFADPYTQEDFAGAKHVADPLACHYDAVVMTTPHKEFDLKKLSEMSRVTVDAKGALRDPDNKLINAPNIFRI